MASDVLTEVLHKYNSRKRCDAMRYDVTDGTVYAQNHIKTATKAMILPKRGHILSAEWEMNDGGGEEK